MPVALLFWCTFHTDGSVCIPYTLVLYLFLHIDDCTSFLGIYIVPYLCMPFLIGTLIQVTLHLFVFILDYLTNYLFFVICAFRIYNASLHVFLWWTSSLLNCALILHTTRVSVITLVNDMPSLINSFSSQSAILRSHQTYHSDLRILINASDTFYSFLPYHASSPFSVLALSSYLAHLVVCLWGCRLSWHSLQLVGIYLVLIALTWYLSFSCLLEMYWANNS